MTVASQSPKFCPIPVTWHLWKTRELDLGYYVCFPLWKCSICFRALLICYYCNFYVPGYIFPYAFHSFLLPQQWSKFTPVCFDTTGDSKGNSYSKGMRNFLYTSCISHSVLQFQERRVSGIRFSLSTNSNLFFVLESIVCHFICFLWQQILYTVLDLICFVILWYSIKTLNLFWKMAYNCLHHPWVHTNGRKLSNLLLPQSSKKNRNWLQ